MDKLAHYQQIIEQTLTEIYHLDKGITKAEILPAFYSPAMRKFAILA